MAWLPATPPLRSSPFPFARASPNRLPLPRPRPILLALVSVIAFSLFFVALAPTHTQVALHSLGEWTDRSWESVSRWTDVESVKGVWKGWGGGTADEDGEENYEDKVKEEETEARIEEELAEEEGVRTKGKVGSGEVMSENEEEKLESQADQAEAKMAEADDLPECKRTLLFKFPGFHGFASTYLGYMHVLSLSTHYNFTLLVDDSEWNYGRLTDYFNHVEPEDLPSSRGGCRRREDWRTMRRRQAMSYPQVTTTTTSLDGWFSQAEDEDQITEFGVKKVLWEAAIVENWAGTDHVVFKANRLQLLDFSILSRNVDTHALAQLHAADRATVLRLASSRRTPLPRPLEPTTVLPSVFSRAFLSQMDHLSSRWSPNAALESAIAHLATSLDLPTTTSVFAEPDVDTERPVRPLNEAVVAVHIRLGDKSLEIHHVSPLRFLTRTWVAQYLAPLHHSLKTIAYPYERLTARRTVGVVVEAAERALDGIKEEFAPAVRGERPTLVVISDDVAAVDLVRKHQRAERWRVVSPGEVPLAGIAVGDGESAVKRRKRAELVAAERLRRRQIPSESHSKSDSESPSPVSNADLVPAPAATKLHHQPEHPGFSESDWNSMAASDRLAQSLSFVRDLTLTARVADAIVLTPTSNVGRMWSLMFGRKFVGRVEDGKAGEGERREWRECRRRIWSADVRWFPTTYFF